MDKPAALTPTIQASTPDQSKLNWLDIANFIRRYRLIILLVFVTTVAGAYATVSLLTEKYDTRASILVKMGRENLDPPPTVRNQNVFSSGLRREEVLSEIQFLKSRQLIERAVSEIGLEAFRVKHVPPPGFFAKVKFYVKQGLRAVRKQYEEALYALNLVPRLPEGDAVLAEITDSLEVEHQKDTDVIALTLRMGSPELSRRVLERIIAAYMISRIELRQNVNVGSFLSAEAKRLRQELDESETKVAAWKQQHGLSSIADQKTALIQQITSLTADRDATAREIRSVAQELEVTRKLLQAAPDTVKQSRQEVASPSLLGLRQRLVTLQSERAHLLTKFLPTSEVVVANASEIERIRELIQAEAATQTGSETFQVNPIRQDLIKAQQAGQVRLAGLESRAAIQANQVQALQSQLARLEAADQELARFDRQKQIEQGQYLEMLRRQQEAEIAAKLDVSRISNVTLLSPPTSTLEPVYPRKMLIMGVALGLGLILGLGLSLMLAYMDDTAYDENQVETALALPCLGAVSAVGSAPEARSS